MERSWYYWIGDASSLCAMFVCVPFSWVSFGATEHMGQGVSDRSAPSGVPSDPEDVEAKEDKDEEEECKGRP